MLKIFCDKKYMLDGMEHIPMLYPFWGNEPENSQVPQVETIGAEAAITWINHGIHPDNFAKQT